MYTITSAAELAWVAEQVNSGARTFAGETVMLSNDIDLSAYYWTPEGKSSTYCFRGTF